MKAHKQKHFTKLLQICTFLKYHQPYPQNEKPQQIKLMNLDELYQNIICSQYETILMRTIIIYLLNHMNKDIMDRKKLGASFYYLSGDLQKYRKDIIQMYYMELAIQEYFCIGEGIGQGVNRSQFSQIGRFYQLDLQMKFTLLSQLIKNMSFYSNKNNSKKQIQDDKKQEQNKNGSKINKIQQIIILGQDNKFVYFFIHYLPEYVLTYQMGTWQILNKNQTNQRILKLLAQPENVNTLVLCENLSHVYCKFMKEVSNISVPIRLHRLKQKEIEQKKQRVQHLKKKLFQINKRYDTYLKNFDNRCWGFLVHRQNYINKLTQAKTLSEIIQAFKLFYVCSSSKIYKCLCDDQKSIPIDNIHEFYDPQVRYHCNINTVSVRINKIMMVKSEEMSLKIIKQDHADLHALMEINVLILQKAVQALQQKAKKYYEKQKRLQSEKSFQQEKQVKNTKKSLIRVTRRSQSSLSSMSISNSITKTKQPKVGMQLRQKKKKNKKFGVTLIDSDESFEESKNSKMSSNFQRYQYKTKKMAGK